jgi:hypothetical protein
VSRLVCGGVWGWWSADGLGRGSQESLSNGVSWFPGGRGGRVVGLRLALEYALALAFPFAAVVLSGGRPDGTTSGAMYGANTSEGIGGQPVVLVPNPKVLEQLGVAGTAPALSPCAAGAHWQGASKGV